MTEQIIYRKAVTKDIDEIKHLYCYTFLQNEPLRVLMDIDIPREVLSLVEQAVKVGMESGLTYVAEVSDEIVGIRVCMVDHRGDEFYYAFPDYECNQRIQIYSEALNQIYQGINLFDVYQSDVIVICKGLAVKNDYQRRGIATELVRKTIDECRRQGYKAMFSETTGVCSKAIYDKFNFDTLRTMDFGDLQLDKKTVMSDFHAKNSKVVLHGRKL